MRLSDVPRPGSTVAQAAYEVCATYSSPALLNHCRRSYVWAAALGDERGIAYDAEIRWREPGDDRRFAGLLARLRGFFDGGNGGGLVALDGEYLNDSIAMARRICLGWCSE